MREQQKGGAGGRETALVLAYPSLGLSPASTLASDIISRPWGLAPFLMGRGGFLSIASSPSCSRLTGYHDRTPGKTLRGL